MSEPLPARLRALELRLASLEPGNTDDLIAIGAGLEEAVTGLDHPHLPAFLLLCLEALEGIYSGDVGAPVACIRAVGHVVGASERYLRSGKYASDAPLRVAGRALWAALERPDDGCPWPAVAVRREIPEEGDEGTSLIEEFLIESAENLDQLDQDLLALEKEPDNHALLSRIFRTIHTIKGTCGFLGFAKLEALAHAGESLLSLLRDGLLEVTTPIADALLALVDSIRQILAAIDASGKEGEGDYTALTRTLTLLQALPDTGDAQPIARQLPGAPSRAAAPVAPPLGAAPERLGGMLISQGYLLPEDLAHALALQAGGDTRRVGEILTEMGLVTPDIIERALLQLGASAGNRGRETSIRVDVGLLDRLMNLVGELVLTRNQLAQHAGGQDAQTSRALQASAQRLNLVTTELQDAVMKTRMQPIGTLWSKIPRIVRDLAHTCGRQVVVELEGKDTELDKSLIEAIRDPLIHLLRNAVDHGIEAPADRLAAGKPAEGQLRLRAFHESGQVLLELRDDGGGINPERVKARALERGLITAQEARDRSEREIIDLIFLPGFSTAPVITTISGRGVGMDVVRTNIEKIGGTVEVQSERGRGTTITVKIPLTLAIIPALLVGLETALYAIPQGNLVELVRLELERVEREIELVYGAPLYRLRGRLLPLVYLHEALGLPQRPDPGRSAYLIVLQAGDIAFGLVVDRIADTQEIVVKPLGKHVRALPTYAGATILGDGRVALILDVLALAQHARPVTDGVPARQPHRAPLAETGTPSQTLLLFRVGPTGQWGMPLSSIARLEELPRSRIEQVGTRLVAQYRGQILPLVPFARGRNEPAVTPAEGPLTLVVLGDTAPTVGLMVDAILDIIEEQVELTQSHGESLCAGTAVIQGRVTPILDTRALLRQVAEENDGDATPVLHLLPGGLSLRDHADPGAGGDAAAAPDTGSAGTAAGRGTDQPAWSDHHRPQPAKPAPSGRAA